MFTQSTVKYNSLSLTLHLRLLLLYFHPFFFLRHFIYHHVIILIFTSCSLLSLFPFNYSHLSFYFHFIFSLHIISVFPPCTYSLLLTSVLRSTLSTPKQPLLLYSFDSLIFLPFPSTISFPLSLSSFLLPSLPRFYNSFTLTFLHISVFSLQSLTTQFPLPPSLRFLVSLCSAHNL